VPRRPEGDETRRILSSIRRLVRALRLEDRQSTGRYGLTGAQICVLHALQASDGISLNELSERIATDQSSASVVVQRLVESGLVSRTARADDRRHVELRLTQRGRAVVRDAPSPAQQKIADIVEVMAPPDRRKFAKLLESFVDELSRDD
jgi:DNA-binding MarR family transcriptional regulator